MVRRRGFVVPRRTVRRFKLIFVCTVLACLLMVLDARLRPVITTMAQYQCRVVSVFAMNQAVMEELGGMDENMDLLQIEKAPDGSVNSVRVNSVGINRLKAQLTNAVSKRLQSVPKQDVRIPLGTLLGWQILAGRGPDVRLQLVPASFVDSSVVDTVETAGINQTQLRVFIQFKVQMSALLPGYSTSVTVEDQVCVAQTMIVGKVPEFYAAP